MVMSEMVGLLYFEGCCICSEVEGCVLVSGGYYIGKMNLLFGK